MGDNKVPKSSKKYFCKNCDFICSRKSQYDRHILTLKHQNGYKMVTNGDNKVPKSSIYECECGNTYKHRQGLSRHKNVCYIHQKEIIEQNTENINISTNDFDAEKMQKMEKMIIQLMIQKQENTVISPANTVDMDKMAKMFTELMTQNQDFIKDVLVKAIPTVTNTNTNSHNTTNNQFNINMFLNEHCKNAMNITDFIESLPLTAEAYNNTIENGLTKNMTTMITDGLNNMDILKRPIHCTDPARKTIYIKDNDTWEKDTELKLLLENITHLACKHRGNIHKWQDVNEGWAEIEDLQTKLTNIVYHTMEDVENDEKEMNKIYRAISKNTYLTSEIKDQYK